MQKAIKKSSIKFMKFIFITSLSILVAIYNLFDFNLKDFILKYSPTSYIIFVSLILIVYFIFLIYELKNIIDELEVNLDKLKRRDELLEHDIKLFNKSNEILSEEKLMNFIHRLERDDSYLQIQLEKNLKFIDFHEKESNQYLSKDINIKCNNLISSLNDLGMFLATYFFQYPPKAIDQETQYCLYPDLNIDRKGNGSEQDLEAYLSYQEKLYNLTENVSKDYREYRRSIKNILHI